MEKFAKYYRALCACELRFPISGDSSQVSIAFTWYDSFQDTKKATQKNVHFEKAAILFCLVSLASQRGIEAVRTTEVGMKEAVEQFCCAAGACCSAACCAHTDQPSSARAVSEPLRCSGCRTGLRPTAMYRVCFSAFMVAMPDAPLISPHSCRACRLFGCWQIGLLAKPMCSA